MKIIVQLEFPDQFEKMTDEFIFSVMLSKSLFQDVKYKVFNRVNNKDVTLDQIEISVCNFLKCEPEDVQNPSRQRTNSNGILARQLCHHIAKNCKMWSLSYIGQRFGNKDHATVLNSNRRILEQLQTDKFFRNEFEPLIESFK